MNRINSYQNGCVGSMSLAMNSVIVGDHPVLLDEPVEEVDVIVVEVNVGHMDVDELVNVELVVQVVRFVNHEICGSCVL